MRFWALLFIAQRVPTNEPLAGVCGSAAVNIDYILAFPPSICSNIKQTKVDGGGGGDDIFAIDDSENDRGIVPKAKATAKGKANAATTKGKGRVNTKNKSPPKAKVRHAIWYTVA